MGMTAARNIGFVLLFASVLAMTSATGALAVAGALDPTFGGDGTVTTNFSAGPSAAAAVALQTDGKIVAAGSEDDRFALTRYNQDGTLDPSFSGNGEVITNFTAGSDQAFGVAIQANGKIVTAGVANGGSSCYGGRFALARYEPNGALDTGFGAGGRVTTSFKGGSCAKGVAIQANGKIVAVGAALQGGEFALARYNHDGSLDTSFGGNGKVTTGFSGGPAYAVAIQTDGKIVAAGVHDFFGFALARFNPNGTLDSTFGHDGTVDMTIGNGEEAATALAILANGKIVAAGYTDQPHESSDTFGPARFALARYRVDGTLDSGFGGDGTVTTRFGNGGAVADGVAIDSHGKIVAVGSARDLARFALARYTHDGTLDPAFSGNGKVTTNVAVGDNEAFGVALQPDGKIVAAGSAREGFALARYLGT